MGQKVSPIGFRTGITIPNGKMLFNGQKENVVVAVQILLIIKEKTYMSVRFI